MPYVSTYPICISANQVRFSTIELSEIETRILNAASHSLEIEKLAFEDLCSKILTAITISKQFGNIKIVSSFIT